MSSRQNDSWRNQYHAVEEFDLPLERDRMLPSSSHHHDNHPSAPTSPVMADYPPPPPSSSEGARRVAGGATGSGAAGMSASSSSSSSSQPIASSSSQVTVQQRNSRSFPSSPLNPQGLPQGRPSTSSGGSHQNHGLASKPIPRSPSSASQPLQYPPSLVSPSPPTHPPVSPFGSMPRPGSRGSFTFSSVPASPNATVNGRSGLGLSGTQTPTTELLAAHHSFGAGALPTVGSRGSMILYRRVDSGVFGGGGGGGSGTTTPVQVPAHTGVSGMSGMSEEAPSHAGLLPPQLPFSNNRSSVYSTSGDSSLYGVERGLVAYAYDPDEDDESDDEEGDWLHDPAVAYPGSSEAKAAAIAAAAAGAAGAAKGKGKPLPRLGIDPQTGRKITDPTHPLYIPKPYIAPRISWRGLVNIGTLVAMVASLLCLFVVYPMVRFYADDGINARISGNLRINSTGQAEYFPGEEDVGEDGATPTSTRPPRTTVTSINEGGNIFDRRAEEGAGLLGILGRAIVGREESGSVRWKREVDDWAVEFPAPSYNLNFFGGEVKDAKAVEDKVEEEMAEVKQVVRACIPTHVPSATLSREEVMGLLVKVDFVVAEEVMEGQYWDGQWIFTKTPNIPAVTSSDEDEEQEDEADDAWVLVKKQLVASKSVTLSLLDDSSSTSSSVTIRGVRVFSEESRRWEVASQEGCEGDKPGFEVKVSAKHVLDVASRLDAALKLSS